MRAFLALLLALGLAACAPKPAGGPIVLTYASAYSPTHPFSRADADWMKYVETASGQVDQVRVQPLPRLD